LKADFSEESSTLHPPPVFAHFPARLFVKAHSCMLSLPPSLPHPPASFLFSQQILIRQITSQGRWHLCGDWHHITISSHGAVGWRRCLNAPGVNAKAFPVKTNVRQHLERVALQVGGGRLPRDGSGVCSCGSTMSVQGKGGRGLFKTPA